MKRIKAFWVFLVILIIWQIVSMANIFSSYLLPSPLDVLKIFLSMLSDHSLQKDLLVSLIRVAIGFSISLILAFALAMIFYLFKNLSLYFDGFLSFLRNVAPLSLIPLLILWFGIGELSKIVVIVMASFFPIFLNVQKGFMVCDKDLIEVGKIFGYSKFEIFKNIVLPSALKDIFTGIRIGLGYAWRAIIAAEMIAASSGLGYMINFSRQMSRTDKVLVGIIVIGFIGRLTDFLFVKIAGYFLKGDLKNEWFNS